jgi:hypothetical protein
MHDLGGKQFLECGAKQQNIRGSPKQLLNRTGTLHQHLQAGWHTSWAKRACGIKASGRRMSESVDYQHE